MILLNRAGLPLPACHFAVVLDEEVLDESCGSDVKAELVPELDDNPRITRSTKVRNFPLCIGIPSHFWSTVVFDRWTTLGNIRFSPQSFPSDRTAVTKRTVLGRDSVLPLCTRDITGNLFDRPPAQQGHPQDYF